MSGTKVAEAKVDAKLGSAEATQAAQVPLSRDAMRAKIFGAKPEKETIDFFGTRVELRQPSLGVMLEARNASIEEASVQMLLNFAFVPGTEEKVFEVADEDSIREIPMGPDLQRLYGACNKLLGVDTEALEKQVKNAMKSPKDGLSESADDVDSGGAGEG